MRALYAAFDRFPTRKGAATHIARFAPALFEWCGGGVLHVLGDDGMPLHQREGQVDILRYLPEPGANLLQGALGYMDHLADALEERPGAFSLCQFRDPWSGLPILEYAGAQSQPCATVYEVNALPSIELASRYPGISPRALAKIHVRELHCLHACDAIVTPSRTTAAMLAGLGVDGRKVTVVPNGADVRDAPPARPLDAPPRYLIYFGAMQRWQGVDTLLQAFARLADIGDLHLVLCASDDNRDARALRRLAERLGVDARTHWRFALDEEGLAAWLGHAQASIAPLADCARNVVQGCAPLKILESMAAGVPVLASDLPPVRELLRDGIDGRLVAPDRPGELARAIRILLAYPRLAAEWGGNARQRIADAYTWEHSLAALRRVHDGLRERRSHEAQAGIRQAVAIAGAVLRKQ